jgi:hypothetical protein
MDHPVPTKARKSLKAKSDLELSSTLDNSQASNGDIGNCPFFNRIDLI